MVQLSTLVVEKTSLPKGSSAEKNNASEIKDNGFDSAYKEQKMIHESREGKKLGQSNDTASSTEQKKAVKQKGESSPNSEEPGAHSKKNKQAKLASPAHVQSETVKKSLKLSTADTGKSIKKEKTPSFSQEQISLSVSSELVTESLLQEKNNPAVEGKETKANSVKQIALENKEGGESPDLNMLKDFSQQASQTLSSRLQQNHSGIENDKDNTKNSKKSDEKYKVKSTPDLKITVDDRRSVKESSPLLKEVEVDKVSNKLTLELIPSEDISSVLSQGDLKEQGDTGKTFSLMTAEEQKGAALLDRQLQDKGNQELTKNIRFVLKDNKEGEIKLILKPEALGKVRINLNLSENNIVGKIIVENNSVRQVFLNNLASLTKALEDSGFNSAALDVSVGGGQTRSGSQQREEAASYFTANALDGMDAQIPIIYEDGINLNQVNLVV